MLKGGNRMMEQFEEYDDDTLARQRARRREELKRRKKEQERRRRLMKQAAPVLVLILVVVGISFSIGHTNAADTAQTDIPQGAAGAETIGEESVQNAEDTEGYTDADGTENDALAEDTTELSDMETPGSSMPEETGVYHAGETANTVYLGEEFASEYAILLDLSSDTILAEKNAYAKMNPASMTKVLTVLVAAEHMDIADLEDTFTMTLEITDYCFVNGCSAAGFEDGETISVRDLYYGTILPSGGEAAVGLATYIAGSQEAFVELMNEKLDELGLSDSAHVTNCVGLYDENHYCTAYDMAVIMKAAQENDWCRKVLSEHIYTTTKTAVHPEGIELSNWFLRRIEDKDTHGLVLCGKTGYVTQSGNCAVSYAYDEAGNAYICVTGNAHSAWRAIYDHVELFERFL